MAGLLKVLFTQLIVIYDFKKIWYDKISKTIFKLMNRKKYALNFFWNSFCCKKCQNEKKCNLKLM